MDGRTDESAQTDGRAKAPELMAERASTSKAPELMDERTNGILTPNLVSYGILRYLSILSILTLKSEIPWQVSQSRGTANWTDVANKTTPMDDDVDDAHIIRLTRGTCA